MNNQELLSAGTPADSAMIQLLETIAVVSAAVTIALAIVASFGFAVLAAGVALFTLGAAYALRHELVERNEQQARDARTALYSFPIEREETIRNIAAPDDLKNAALGLIGESAMTRLQISNRLSAKVGSQRATEYLSLILQNGDRRPGEEPADAAQPDAAQ